VKGDARPRRASGDERRTSVTRSDRRVSARECHFTDEPAYDAAADSRDLDLAGTRVGVVAASLAALHCVALAALSAADARHVPGLQRQKEWCIVLASLSAALPTAACAATVLAWPVQWWLTHGRRLLACMHVLAACVLPVLQCVALQIHPGAAVAIMSATVLQAALLACWRTCVLARAACRAAAQLAARSWRRAGCERRRKAELTCSLRRMCS
jgi:hypothetical protein